MNVFQNTFVLRVDSDKSQNIYNQFESQGNQNGLFFSEMIYRNVINIALIKEQYFWKRPLRFDIYLEI